MVILIKIVKEGGGDGIKAGPREYLCMNAKKTPLFLLFFGSPQGGTLIYNFMGMCSCERYGFQSSLVWDRV